MDIRRPFWSKLYNLLFFVSAVSTAQDWNPDLASGLAEAARSDKKILLYFSVPEHCPVCVELEEKVFSSDEFAEFSQDYVLVRPQFSETDSFEQKQGKLLIVEKYNRDGFFPLVVILDKFARTIGKSGVYNGEPPRVYIDMLSRLSR